MPLNPSRFATIKSWAAESPPRRTAARRRRSSSRAAFKAAVATPPPGRSRHRARTGRRPPPGTRSRTRRRRGRPGPRCSGRAARPGWPSGSRGRAGDVGGGLEGGGCGDGGAGCGCGGRAGGEEALGAKADILPYDRRLQIRQSSDRKHPETAVGNMQHFQSQAPMETTITACQLTQFHMTSFKISIHAYTSINHLCRMHFPSGRLTNFAHPLLVTNEPHPLSFSANESGARPGWVLELLQPNVTKDGWRILDFLCAFLRYYMRNHNKKHVRPFLERSLINLIWFGEFSFDNFGLLMIRLDETFRRLLVRTGHGREAGVAGASQLGRLWPSSLPKTWKRTE